MTSVAALPHGGASSAFTHDVVWCPRPCGRAVAVHRFVPRDGNHGRSVEAACRLLNDMAKQEAALNAKSDSSSNVGGYHSARDLWMRPAVQEAHSHHSPTAWSKWPPTLRQAAQTVHRLLKAV